MARLNAWFSSGAASNAANGDYSGIISELPGVVFDDGDKGTIFRTTLGNDGLGGYSLRNKNGQQILDYNRAKIVGFYLSGGYNDGNRLWLEKNGETFHIDQYRDEKSNVTMDIVTGVAVVATAGAASYLVSANGAVGALGASEATIGALPATGGASTGAAGGSITLGNVGSALSAVGTVAKGIGQAAGSVGAVAGAIGAVQAINGQGNKPVSSQIGAGQGEQLTGAGVGGILNSVSPYLLFGGLIISIALFAKGK